MSGGEPSYYWDACLFLAWLKNETTRKPGEMDAIHDFVRLIESHKIRILTSAITLVEVTEAKLPPGVLDRFHQLLRKRNVSVISVDIAIAKKARELKDYYSQRAAEFDNKTLSTADAVHLATATLYEPNEFHTFDGKDNNRNGFLGLLKLNGDVGGYPLTIMKPKAKQLGLDGI